MERNVLIFGNHPMASSVVGQYRSMGFVVDRRESLAGISTLGNYQELFVFPQEGLDDGGVLDRLEALAEGLGQSEGADGARPLCHLLLRSKVSLWLLQTLDLYHAINRRLEIYPFTLEDQWAKTVLCSLPGSPLRYQPLDRERIDAQSAQRVHLLVCGMSDLGESLAQHAALVAHYPNYVRDHTLRTRITIVDRDLRARRNAFTQRYQNLMDHSYYRYVDLSSSPMQTYFHTPMYNGVREDFIDVEWEFVEGDLHDPIFRNKLAFWATDRSQQLTIALCADDSERNLSEAFALPKEVYECQVPVLVHVPQSGMLDRLGQSAGYQNIRPIGMCDCGYDVSLPLLQMAKRLNYFYACSYGQQGTPTDMPLEQVEQEWHRLDSFTMRYANLYNVMTIATKMRSLGHEDTAWGRFYALTQEEVEQISAVEHNRWSLERLMLGFRPPTDAERKEIADNIADFTASRNAGGDKPAEDLKTVYKKRKVHYDLCAYQELGEDKTGQNVRVYDYDLTACIPLIANSFNEMQP